MLDHNEADCEVIIIRNLTTRNCRLRPVRLSAQGEASLLDAGGCFHNIFLESRTESMEFSELFWLVLLGLSMASAVTIIGWWACWKFAKKRPHTVKAKHVISTAQPVNFEVKPNTEELKPGGFAARSGLPVKRLNTVSLEVRSQNMEEGSVERGDAGNKQGILSQGLADRMLSPEPALADRSLSPEQALGHVQSEATELELRRVDEHWNGEDQREENGCEAKATIRDQQEQNDKERLSDGLGDFTNQVVKRRVRQSRGIKFVGKTKRSREKLAGERRRMRKWQSKLQRGLSIVGEGSGREQRRVCRRVLRFREPVPEDGAVKVGKWKEESFGPGGNRRLESTIL